MILALSIGGIVAVIGLLVWLMLWTGPKLERHCDDHDFLERD